MFIVFIVKFKFLIWVYLVNFILVLQLQLNENDIFLTEIYMKHVI